MLSVLAAIDVPGGRTLTEAAVRTHLDKKSVATLIAQAREQAGVDVRKDEVTRRYRVADWGAVIRRHGAHEALRGGADDSAACAEL